MIEITTTHRSLLIEGRCAAGWFVGRSIGKENPEAFFDILNFTENKNIEELKREHIVELMGICRALLNDAAEHGYGEQPE